MVTSGANEEGRLLSFVQALRRSRADQPADVLNYALRIVRTSQLRAFLAQFCRLVRRGGNASRKDNLRRGRSPNRPSPELKRTLIARGVSVAQNGLNCDVALIEEGDGFVRRSGLDNDVAASPKIVGDDMSNEHVTVDN
jgi:hypothetical protein